MITRVLTVARVTVLPEHEAEYIRTVHALADIGAPRGQNLWLFKNSRTPHTYLEFSESRTEMSHRSRASRTDYEMQLERRLHQIAQYAPGSAELWEEVTAPQPEESSGWEAEPEEDEGA